MKKKVWFSVALILALCVSVCVFWGPVRYRLYPGDRIRGVLSVTVDGVPYALTTENCRLPEKGRLHPANNGAVDIALRGGDYGEYPVSVLLLDGAALRLCCFQHNWWNVTAFELRADVDTRAGIVRWTGTVSTVTDNGQKTTDAVEADRVLPEADGGFVIGL